MELWYTEPHSKDVKFSIKFDRQLYTEQSDFQRIDVFESEEFGRFLTLDGIMMLTEKDEFIYHEMIVHVPMAVHPNVRKVLVIGAGDGGCLIRRSSTSTLSRSTSASSLSAANGCRRRPVGLTIRGCTFTLPTASSMCANVSMNTI